MIFFSLSVRLVPATVRQAGFDYRLSVSTTDDDLVNDELHVSPDDSPRTYISNMLLQLPPDPLFPNKTNIFGARLDLDVPDPGDANHNGISDLFEVSRAVAPITTEGEITHDDGQKVISGTVSTTWSKVANSTTGLCVLQLKIADLALDLTFNHTFEIFDYRGALTYKNIGTNVDATVSLQRQGAAGSFSGPLRLSIVDRDELTYQSDLWTGPGGLTYSVLGTADSGADFTVLRGGLNTNYFALLYFADGNPATPFADEYDLWQFDIRDGNDGDGDGFADFSDPPISVPPAAPIASLRIEGGVLKMTITAKAGQKVLVEQKLSLEAPVWESIFTRTLFTDSEDVDLPKSAEPFRIPDALHAQAQTPPPRCSPAVDRTLPKSTPSA